MAVITCAASSTTRGGVTRVARYDPATGLVSYVGQANEAGTDATTKRVTTTYDRWGRKVGYTRDGRREQGRTPRPGHQCHYARRFSHLPYGMRYGK